MTTAASGTRRIVCPMLMLLGVALLYAPPGVLEGNFEILGFDFLMLHKYRIEFAQQALAQGTLPAWYPREFCGSPFWANTQNFPFIPTRLIFLWLPAQKLFVASIIASALMSAMFTYLFARRLGMGAAGSAVAGWTFASGGFFASRVATGHLSLLEAYPALPLLLWLIERLSPPHSTLARGSTSLTTGQNTDSTSSPHAGRGRIVALGIAAMCISLAGHPQLSIYALGAAFLYTWIRGAGRLRWSALGSIAAGIGCASFALVPMAMLAARSTRVLALDRAPNDIPMPYARLLAAFAPWRDYVPDFNPAGHFAEFTSSPWFSYFWDTVWYVGLWPWAACVLVVGLLAGGKIRADRRIVAIAIIAAGGLLFALPWTRELTAATGVTLLRSPARLIYLTIFGLSLAAGAGISLLIGAASALPVHRWAGVVAMSIIVLHVLDLARHDRRFIMPNRREMSLPPDVESQVLQRVGDGRAAIDLIPLVSITRQVDDASLFDSIILSRSYRAIVAMRDAPAGYNNQWLSANIMDGRILRMCGVRVLITLAQRPWLALWHSVGEVNIYKIEGASERARFVPLERALRGTDLTAQNRLRDPAFDPAGSVVVEDPAAPAATQPAARSVLPARYDRVGSDRMIVRIDAPADGYVQVLEAFDPGWSAKLDGQPAAIVPANLMFMAVRVNAGPHVLEFQYRTPGRGTGLVFSGIGVLALLAIAGSSRTAPPAFGEELSRQRLDPPAQ